MRIEFHAAIDSTQRRARELVERGNRAWDAVCADHQTAGRGRQGAHWYDTPNQSLLVSLILWDIPLPEPVGLVGLLAALAAAPALEAHYPDLPPVQLKYPNDLILCDRKLGGVLAEIVEHTAVVGVGINLMQSEFPHELSNLAISVQQARHALTPPSRNENGNASRAERAALIEAIFQNLLHLMVLWRTHPEQVVALWQARDCSVGRPYQVQDLPYNTVGVALGVEPDFRLRLRLPDGAVHSTYYASALPAI
ncbi:MAG: biotin--[acetyl-CoA-carboxylase] ligase [Fimbriimonadales bacterium]|nr:biotin--[acetyl-CoA-carboxylase] ligase [Fimbriimonadales bacterium]